MITPAYMQLMARYNRWQNENLYGAASSLTDHDRKLDRGAFFRSIHETLNHILWADGLWLSRFTDFPAPEAPGFDGSVNLYKDWDDLCAARKNADAFIEDWANSITKAEIEGELNWHSGAMGRDLTRPRWLLFVQIFNHQTHHRGQVHAMLTAAGARPGDTDVPFMPGL